MSKQILHVCGVLIIVIDELSFSGNEESPSGVVSLPVEISQTDDSKTCAWASQVAPNEQVWERMAPLGSSQILLSS